MKQPKTIRKFLYIFGILAVFLFINWFAVPQIATTLQSRHLNQVFSQQVTLLSTALMSIGIAGSPIHYDQCGVVPGTTHWITRVDCDSFNNYPYSSSTGLPSDYLANATKLDQLLQANGWINDSMKNNRVDFTSLDPVTAAQPGDIDLPFHKNIGTISCNLDVVFSSLNYPSPLMSSSGSLNINTFSCSEQMSYPELRPSIPTFQGGA